MNKRMREIKAQIESLHGEATTLYEAKNYEAANEKLNEIDELNKEYEVAARMLATEKADVPEDAVVDTKATTKVTNFADSIRKVSNGMNAGTGEDGGYTIPEDISTDIEELRSAKFSLQELVDVTPVSTMSGRRTYKKRSQKTGFTKVGEGQKIGIKATPQYGKIDYKIDKYAGIYPVTNELLEDSDASIFDELTNWLADESRVTRNRLILEAIATKTPVAIAGLDGIKKAINVTLGQAFAATSKVITNDDGLQYLDTLKDDSGNYLLKASAADPMKKVLSAGATSVPLEVLPNEDLATTGNKVPFIIGDLKEGIKLFDRKWMNIVVSNTAVAGSGASAINAFEEDLTLFRGIEREDVEVKDDKAFVNGYIEVPVV